MINVLSVNQSFGHKSHLPPSKKFWISIAYTHPVRFFSLENLLLLSSQKDKKTSLKTTWYFPGPTKTNKQTKTRKKSSLSSVGINQHQPSEHTEQAKEPSIIIGQENWFYFHLDCSPKVEFTFKVQTRARIINPRLYYIGLLVIYPLPRQNKCLTCSNLKPFPSTHDLFLSSQLCLHDAAMKEGKVTRPESPGPMGQLPEQVMICNCSSLRS